MKYFGGLVLLAYAALHVLNLDRIPEDERGVAPAELRAAPGGILLWHTGFMGGK